ncbi:MAG: hypothetical protein GXP08_05150 [Gammaproteobacteria bacterium]|nr:hypothetical protein [Gammaproteobacteria bacterium]
MPSAFIIFHLNLAYSSIAANRRTAVINHCYWPLLRLAEELAIPLGIEMTSWTLQEIQRLDPSWVTCLKKQLKAKKCELIGSGYCQIIGPLVPYEVNYCNQRYGIEDYHNILAITPKIALLNEMAYSSGMVGVYKEAGYHGIIMDRDNVCLALGRDSSDLESMPLFANGLDGNSLPVLWSDSILFQKFQRYAHGDISLSQYLDYFWRRAEASCAAVPIYCNDAEIFDYRPGRFTTEPVLKARLEWQRIHVLLNQLRDSGVRFKRPTDLLQTQFSDDQEPVILNSAHYPVPVKKQLKYNISRWAITGHNDLWLNTQCHKIYQAIVNRPLPQTRHLWRRLCYCWSSDFRTHITDDRWRQVCAEIAVLREDACVAVATPQVQAPVNPLIMVSGLGVDDAGVKAAGFRLEVGEEERLLLITTEKVKMTLNLRRGIAIESLAYSAHGFVPVLGTLQHGYFKSIEHGADFYSGAVVVDLIGAHRRITDLEAVNPALFLRDNELIIRSRIPTDLGDIVKEFRLSHDAERLTVSIDFPGWERPLGTIRAGTITLLPEAFTGSLSIAAKMGGKKSDVFALNDNCRHDRPASSLVSCTTGLGLPHGELVVGDDTKKLSITWDAAQCAVFAMLYHQKVTPSMLTRVIFSLCEIDETFRPGGRLPRFEYSLSPWACKEIS